jgi:hypothetical protein
MQRIRPKDLFITQFRSAIRNITVDGQSLDAATQEAVDGLMNAARNPGLDTKHPYQTANSLASILKTSLARVHACSMPHLWEFPPIVLSDTVTHRCSALFEQTPRLHQWAAVESLARPMTQDLRRSILMDCAASGLPMILHVIEIGQQDESGRYRSPWCRCFDNPRVARSWSFKPGKEWQPVYFEDGKNEAGKWIALMESEGVRLFKDVEIKQLSVEKAEEIKQEMINASVLSQAIGQSESGACGRPARAKNLRKPKDSTSTISAIPI